MLERESLYLSTQGLNYHKNLSAPNHLLHHKHVPINLTLEYIAHLLLMFLILLQSPLPILIVANKHKQFYEGIRDYWDQVSKAFQPA